MRTSDVTCRYAWSLLYRAIAVLFSIGLLFPVNGDTLYLIQNLGSLGAGNAMPTGINTSGIAVGFMTDSGGNSIPVMFDGQTNSLAGIGQANGINSAGTIVGTSYLNNAPLVTEWSNGQSMNLGIPGYGTAINDAGQVAGGMLTATGQLHAFVWSGGNLMDLGSLTGATWSSGYGINSLGQVVGTTMAGGRSSAFVFNGDTTYAVAGSLGGASTYGMAINNSAVVVGSAQNAQGYLNAFESTDQGMMNLGTLGGSQSAAYGINDAGTVVGYSLLAGNTTTHAFAYLGGVLIDLNTLLADGSGWTIEAAYAINNSGDIVGVGNFNDQLYAIELLPTESVDNPAALSVPSPNQIIAAPEPAGLLLTVSGVLLMGGLFLVRSGLLARIRYQTVTGKRSSTNPNRDDAVVGVDTFQRRFL
jgi:probable HAF family extracellular repeat protein